MSEQDKLNEKNTDLSSVNKTRRRLTKAGLAAPVIFSISSKTALGNDCINSGTLSPGTLASRVAGGGSCEITTWEAESPGYWMAKPDVPWPSPYERSMKFSTVFGQTDFQCFFGSKTLIEVMELTGAEDPYQLGFQAVGALLNAAAYSSTFPLTPQEVISLYNQYYSTMQAGTTAQFFDNLNHHINPF